MPNNCNFGMSINGKPKDIKDFLGYFILEEEKGNKEGKYLARTFLEDWKNKEEMFKDLKQDIERGCVFINGWCAWSCYSCWIEGYPDKKDCVKIKDICKKHKINISVESEESGMCFEEEINCNKKGELTNICYNMPVYKCKKCGEECSFPSSYDSKDEECWNCENYGEFDLIKERSSED